MHDAAVVPPHCGCVCVRDYEFGMQGPGEPGFFSCAAKMDDDNVEQRCGDGVPPLEAAEAAVDTCGNYYVALVSCWSVEPHAV